MPPSKEIRLTSTSYVLLGMLDWLGPSTPYRLKRVMAESVEDFFPVPHTSFYAEPARLAAAGYVDEHVERGGRRRRTYSLSARGREALEAWLAEPETRFGEFRFPGMLKIFFGGDPAGFAGAQAAHHARWRSASRRCASVPTAATSSWPSRGAGCSRPASACIAGGRRAGPSSRAASLLE